MNKKTSILTILIFIILFLVIVLFAFLPKRIANNPENTIGNTAGNLNNGGLFCEDEGIIYFSNPYDNESLYKMNIDTSNIQKLASARVKFICSGGKYLYYYQTGSASSSGLGSVRSISGLYRAPKKGGGSTCINNHPVTALNLVGNYLYYQHYDVKTNTTFYRSKIDKSETGPITDYLVNPASAENGIIYYNGMEKDHYLYSYNTQNGSKSIIWEHDVWNPIYQNGVFYYMDVHNNYALCKYDMNTQEVTVLCNDRIDSFNIWNGIIFYQISSDTEPALMRMNTDGSNIELVASGVYENINLTSQYAFFTQYGSNVPVYMTSTAGPIQVHTFDAARDAVMQE